MGSTAITPEQIGALKLASIDAWMKKQAVPVVGTSHKVGDHYLLASPGQSVSIARPDALGEGGGTGTQTNLSGFGFSVMNDVDYTSHFDAIRSAIDSLLQPWVEIPDPSEIDPYVENCRTVSSRLSRTAWSDGTAAHRGAGALLDSYLKTVEDDSDGLRGRSGDAFRQRFLSVIPGVIESYSSLTLTRGGAMLALSDLWSAARNDLSEIIEQAIQAMETIAASGNGTIKHTFDVAGIAIETVKLFAPAAAGKALDFTKLAFEAGSSVAPSNVALDVASYEEGVEKTSEALQALSEHLFHEEGELERLIEAHVEASRDESHRASYVVESPELTETDEIRLDTDKVTTLAQSTLPGLAAELEDIANLNSDCSATLPLKRNSRIGYGWAGPAPTIGRFDDYIHDLLEEVAGEILEGAVELGHLLSDFTQTEESIVAEIDAFLQELDEGSGSIEDITQDRPGQHPVDGSDPLGGPTEVPYAPGMEPGLGPVMSNNAGDLLFQNVLREMSKQPGQ